MRPMRRTCPEKVDRFCSRLWLSPTSASTLSKNRRRGAEGWLLARDSETGRSLGGLCCASPETVLVPELGCWTVPKGFDTKVGCDW